LDDRQNLNYFLAMLPDALGNDAPGKRVRRQTAVQITAFVIFLMLCFAGVKRGIPAAFVLIDPLAAIGVMGAARDIVSVLLWALVPLLLTPLLGRFFCGWICPLGTLLDATGWLLRQRDRISARLDRALRPTKYALLIVVVVAAGLSSQWFFVIDPLSLTYRGLTTGVWPLLTGAWQAVAIGPLLLFGVVLGLTALTPRFFCRYLCPLGALYALFSRTPLVRREVSKCTGCEVGHGCRDTCPMAAIATNPKVSNSSECIVCQTCEVGCPAGPVRFGRASSPPPTNGMSRRHFLTYSAAGAGAITLATLSNGGGEVEPTAIRPPQVIDEASFTDRCVRCGLCTHVCITGGLQPTVFATGLAGMWTPVLVPALGGCATDCNACSQVCPTHAIPEFGRYDKWSIRMGTVSFDQTRCVSHPSSPGDSKQLLTCLKCIDICPTKAIATSPPTVNAPARPISIDPERCVGCGLCEHVCLKMAGDPPALVTTIQRRGEPVDTDILPRHYESGDRRD